MEFPPPKWDFFSADHFETAAVRSPGELGMELLVQVRDNGRIQDHFKIVLGGNSLLTARLPMRDVYKVADFPEWFVSYSKWPADVLFNRNRLTTPWACLTELIKSKEAIVHDAAERMVPYEDVLGALGEQKKKAGEPACAIRWAAGIGDGQKTVLHVQCLPTSATILNGKPLTKG